MWPALPMERLGRFLPGLRSHAVAAIDNCRNQIGTDPSIPLQFCTTDPSRKPPKPSSAIATPSRTVFVVPDLTGLDVTIPVDAASTDRY